VELPTTIARARSPDRPFGQLPESLRITLEQQAQQAADVFQRSSSCVEGRNGQLSLRHHGLRELTTSKLKALRTIHNYVIEREDGTTAVERFFAINRVTYLDGCLNSCRCHHGHEKGEFNQT